VKLPCSATAQKIFNWRISMAGSCKSSDVMNEIRQDHFKRWI
jgi:hypothetical protein